MALNTEMSEKDEVTPVEGGHDVERVTVMQSDVVKDMIPTTVKPAREIHESRDIGSRPRVARGADEKGEVTSVEEGHDVERVTAVRSDVA